MIGTRFRGACECGDHVWAIVTRGFITLTSPADADLLISRKWNARRGKSQRNVYVGNAEAALHEVVSTRRGTPTLGRVAICDHANGNGLDNRRQNLRVCSQSQNHQNLVRRKPGARSKYKGVSRNSRDTKWRGQITVNNRRLHLGGFLAEEDAARAYDSAALAAYGQFARTNKMMGLLP